MSALYSDLKYACRMLRKRPGFTAIALLTLAIAIGANTTSFSLLNTLFLRPVQVDRVEELAVCEAESAEFFFSYAAYQTLRDNNPVFEELAAVSVMASGMTLTRTDRAGLAQETFAYCVSSNYFSMLGGVPAQGRWFLPEEERYGAEPVVIVSHQAWKRYFGESDILDSQILFNDIPFRVVGVAPKGFTGATMVGPEFWLPLGKYALFTPPRWREVRGPEPYPNVIPVGRLRPQLSLAAAQAQLQAVTPRLEESYPQWRQEHGQLNLLPPGRTDLIPYYEQEQRSATSLLTLCLMSVSGAVLVIACLNLASMMIVQGTSRRREIAIRLALGGGRLRIVRQLLIECLLMSLAGGTLGFLLASGGLRIIGAWARTSAVPIEFGSSLVDGRVLLGSLGFCVLATVLFGLKPALRLSRRDVITDIKESGRDALRSAHKSAWAPSGLSVVVQTALSCVLVMGAALFARSAFNTIHANSFFDFDGKLLVQVDFSSLGYDAQHCRQVCQTIKDRFLALPGVESVAFSSSGHFTQTDWNSGPVSEYGAGSEQQTPRIKFTESSWQFNVGRGYFKALGIPLLQGRTFNELDGQADAESVIVINEALARKIRPDGNALNIWIQWGPDQYVDTVKPHRVVGIVSNLAPDDVSDVRPTVYVTSHEGSQPRFVHLLTRGITRQGQRALIGTLSQELFRIDPRIPVKSAGSLEDRSRETQAVWQTGLRARLAIASGVMALFLAALGIYAIKGYMVASRTPEIGIRMSLGATRGNIMMLVFRQGSLLTLVGLGCGLATGLGLAHLLRSMFINVSPLDPISIGVTIMVLALTSVLAGVAPARRAARIDPMQALRNE